MSKYEISAVLNTLFNLAQRVAFFYIRAKFRLKNRAATVYLLQCKTNFTFAFMEKSKANKRTSILGSLH